MAKQSVFAKNAKRKKTVQKYAEKRKRLLEIAKDPKASYEDQLEARQELAKLPVNANPNRVVNRCEVTGRPAATSGTSASPASPSAKWPSRACSPASARQAGSV